MTQTERAILPDWPRLMSEPQAAAYLSLSATTLRKVGPSAKRHGRRVLYDRLDLDRWADRLAGQPLDDAERMIEAQAVESDFFARRKKRASN